MNGVFYQAWAQKRIDKILNVLGQDWFASKKILELGSGHGDIGKHFVSLGAEVTFTDARENYLDFISDSYHGTGYQAQTLVVNQNLEYNLKKEFDLVLHLGVLYHIENWQQDLKCALQHTDLMFLETRVAPRENAKTEIKGEIGNNEFGLFRCRRPVFTQEAVEQELLNLGCKFLRFDSNELNTNWSWDVTGLLTRHVYDWNYQNANSYVINGQCDLHYRRMWLIVK